MQEIEIKLNGAPERIPAGSTIAGLLAGMGLRLDRVAVEKNGEIVPKSAYEKVPVAEGDCLEVVSFVGGG